ncbi:MAG: hypothetical protein JNL21_29890, partial [Myxococcales bacterium]|nr:hypothetical protein [Myxococcales bacterium]
MSTRRRLPTILVSLVAATSLLSQSLARAYTSDVFSSPSAVPTPRPKGEPKQDGAERVDPTGAATWSISIPTAPNRNGAVPRLALSYSSKNPVRGSLAMGWTLDVPKIEVDTSDGRLAEVRYRASDGGRLVRVEEPAEAGWEAYRAEEDATFTRYERKAGMPAETWRARLTDGTVHYFGESPTSKDKSHWRAEPGAVEGRWFLTRTVDKFGNEIQYNYVATQALPPEGGAQTFDADITLSSVEYGANAVAGLTHHTRILFDYAAAPDLCDGSVVPVGALFDFRTGIPTYRGAARLERVRMETRGGGGMVERRRLDLGYDMTELQCRTGVAHAPLRILTSVQETGFDEQGQATQQPPQTFDYNRLERQFDATLPQFGSIGRGNQGPLLPTTDTIRRHTVDVMTLDLDGDGLLDRLSTAAMQGDGQCRASWERNLGAGLLAAPAPIGVGQSQALPTLPWAGAAPGAGELCSLSHQVSNVTNRTVFEPYAGSVCDGQAAFETDAASHLSYEYRDWNHDGLVDLVTAVESRLDIYRAEHDAAVGPDPSCFPNALCTGVEVPGVGCVIPGGGCVRLGERQCGQYVSRVYLNQGNGQFAEPVAVLHPLPLNPEEGRDTFTTSADVDGDGRDDMVAGLIDGGARYYRVYRGQEGGTFSSPPVMMQLPEILGRDPDYASGFNGVAALELAPVSSRSMSYAWANCVQCTGNPDTDYIEEVSGGSFSYTAGRLMDVNGDGLPDYVLARNAEADDPAERTGIRVLYNTGAGFESYGNLAADQRGNRLSVDPEVKAIDAQRQRPRYTAEVLANGMSVEVSDGFSRSVLRSVDFDGDGLVDLVKLPPPRWSSTGSNGVDWDYYEPYLEDDGTPELYVNVGDRLVAVGSSPALVAAKHGLSKLTLAENDLYPTPWSTKTDFLDLDGDGLPESVAASKHAPRTDSDTQPMRSLRAVHNGRGGHTEFHYSVVRGAGVPHPVWVVDGVTSWADMGAEGAEAAIETSFSYEEPVYGPDLYGDYAFRGFRKVVSWLPGGSRTETSRSYEQHYAGLVTLEQVYDLQGNLLKRDTTTYERRELFAADSFPGSVVTFHPSVSVKKTCVPGQDVMSCGVGDGSIATEERFYTTLPLASSGQPGALHTLQWTRRGAQIGAHAGSKVSWNTPNLRNEAGMYLQYSDGETQMVYTPTLGLSVSAATYHYYDASKRCEYWTTRQIDAAPTYAVSTQVCDLTTGNRVFEAAPQQFGTGLGTTTEYDDDARFVKETRNALGHRVLKSFDAATGTQTSERGPNAKQAGGKEVLDGWEKRLDGQGRESEHHVYLDDAMLGYRAELVSRTSYVDVPSPLTKVVTEKKILVGGSTWAKAETERDGLGRAVIERTYEGAIVRAETRRFHDEASNVVRLKVPRPGSYNLQHVEWGYAYDELSRPVAVREPARPGCAGTFEGNAFCGKVWGYEGRVTLERDVVGSAGGQVAQKRTTVDHFGRLVKVEEDMGGAWADTLYGYDGLDNVQHIENADGVVTEMAHDMLGRRTKVTRGSNTWWFGYDKNGNLTSVTSPVPVGGTLADYTTTLAYDALNREIERTPAVRDWSATELATFGTGKTIRTYDEGINGVGRLTTAFQEWGTPDHHQVQYSYEARGLVEEERHSFSILDGAFSDDRSLVRTYTAQGLPYSFTEADGLTPSSSTTLVTTYDGRGLPSVTHWLNHGWSQQVRRLADGRVFHRYWSNATTLFAENNLGFDDAGRVSFNEVRSTLPGEGTPTRRAVQAFSFDGAGDVHRIDSSLSP